MAHPAGYSSDEDEFGGFMSDKDYSGDESKPIPINTNVVSSLNQKLNTLFYAIVHQNLLQVNEILNEGINVNVELREGWIPITLAASMGILDITRELINRGANVNSDKDKCTVLMAVCACPESTSTTTDCLDIINMLIDKGVQVNTIDRTRKSALMFAAANGCVDVVKKLITVCNIELEDNQGWDALFWAVTSSKPEVVKVLMNAGLSISKSDVRGHSLSSYALSQSNEEVIKLVCVNVDDGSNVTIERVYDCVTLFKNVPRSDQLQFLRDVDCILYGIKCEHHFEVFKEINLVNFLSLDAQTLTELGIVIPYEQNRILGGLFKFHHHVYKDKSIPAVPQNSIYSTVDVCNELVAAIRHVVTMEGSIKYLLKSFVNKDEDKFCASILNVKQKIRKMKQTVVILEKLTKKWDRQIQSVDLITSKRSKPVSNWWKFLLFVSVTSLSGVLLTKYR